MAHKMLLPMAKMGRPVFSREELIEKLSKFGTLDEVTQVVDSVLAIPEEEFRQQVESLHRAHDAAEAAMQAAEGRGIRVPGAAGEAGFDDADRMAESQMLAALGDSKEGLQ
jgi:hypothetical protein